jgi:DNA adenine methylase
MYIYYKHMCDYTKPILKWVGGKTQIIDNIMDKFPKTCNNYHEIFTGGGSVLFAFLSKVNNNEIKVNNIYAYDINETLIYLYKNIQSNPQTVIDILNKLRTQHNTYNDTKNDDNNKEQHYYKIRDKYNNMTQEKKNKPKGSALFIFLNKTCFRGLYREGPNGFNVPYGNYKTCLIFDEEHILEVSELIKNVHFICSDFNTSLDNIKKDDFVYMDPPYVPEKKTSFVKYNNNGFDNNIHTLFFTKCHELYDNKIQFVMSNSHMPLVIDTFNDKRKYNIQIIQCKRSINSKKPGSTTNEVIIKTIF